MVLWTISSMTLTTTQTCSRILQTFTICLLQQLPQQVSSSRDSWKTQTSRYQPRTSCLCSASTSCPLTKHTSCSCSRSSSRRLCWLHLQQPLWSKWVTTATRVLSGTSARRSSISGMTYSRDTPTCARRHLHQAKISKPSHTRHPLQSRLATLLLNWRASRASEHEPSQSEQDQSDREQNF